jgi:DnaK suppressor protein
MRKAFLKKMRTTLTRQKQQILQQLDEEIREGKENELDEGMDTYDLASEERDREISLILGDRDRDKLQAIEDALDRIEEGEYGLCEQCEEEIAQARLEALPFTRLCVACQEQLEKKARFQRRVDDDSVPRRSNAVDLDDDG